MSYMRIDPSRRGVMSRRDAGLPSLTGGRNQMKMLEKHRKSSKIQFSPLLRQAPRCKKGSPDNPRKVFSWEAKNKMNLFVHGGTMPGTKLGGLQTDFLGAWDISQGLGIGATALPIAHQAYTI